MNYMRTEYSVCWPFSGGLRLFVPRNPPSLAPSGGSERIVALIDADLFILSLFSSYRSSLALSCPSSLPLLLLLLLLSTHPRSTPSSRLLTSPLFSLLVLNPWVCRWCCLNSLSFLFFFRAYICDSLSSSYLIRGPESAVEGKIFITRHFQ
ncbi:hypothetical protein F4778DRAFT_403432 [Xylariomycetidae sp. FL2044]|nr:hypothetical protein F4778DRAFT_403432 [Xylariomycetidae sp. FL2044]